MEKIVIEFEKFLKTLPGKEKEKIIEEIIKEEFEKVCENFRKRMKEKGLNFREINKIVNQARKNFYAKSSDR
jgi:phosphotransacetylase